MKCREEKQLPFLNKSLPFQQCANLCYVIFLLSLLPFPKLRISFCHHAAELTETQFCSL